VNNLIKHFRIDERLIHGQVATVWVNSLGCNRIIVANDAAVKNEMQITVLKLACPTAVKLSVLSLAKAVQNVKDGKYDSDKVFFITKDIADCKTVLDLGLKIDSVNVGNASHKDGKVKIKNSVSLSEEEIGMIREIIASGVKVTAQMIPNEANSSIEVFFK
jgi:PTS system mannose-specific IIB component